LVNLQNFIGAFDYVLVEALV
jgi:hypothetical protein